jgi:hypothetical protein
MHKKTKQYSQGSTDKVSCPPGLITFLIISVSKLSTPSPTLTAVSVFHIWETMGPNFSPDMCYSDNLSSF